MYICILMSELNNTAEVLTAADRPGLVHTAAQLSPN